MFKWFSKYYFQKKVKANFVLTMICALLVATFTIIIPFLSKFIINEIVLKNNFKQLYLYVTLLGGVYLALLIFNWIVSFYGHKFGIQIERNLRNDTLQKVLSHDFTYFERNKKGKIANNIVNNTRQIGELAHHFLENILMSVVPLVIGFILLLSVNVYLALYLFSFLIISFLLVFKKSANRSIVYKSVYKNLSKINENNFEKLKNIELIQDYQQQDKENKEFALRSKNYANSQIKSANAYVSFFSLYKYLVNLLQISIIILGTILQKLQLTNIGSIVAFVLFTNLITNSFTTILDLFQDFERGYRSLQRVYEIHLYANKTSKSGKNLDFVNGDIEFKNFSFGYNDVNIIENLNLTIKQNSQVGIVGPSGSGKTTLIKALIGLYPLANNQISIGGIDLNDLNSKKLFENVGYLSQNVFIFNDSIFNNIAYSKKNATKQEVIQAAKMAKLDEFIESLPNKYETNIYELGANLSGGQKQRISIARIFLQNPQILILDEATSALDNISEKYIMESLNMLAKNKTVITIAHRLSTVISSDEIIVIKDKKIHEQGTHEKLLNNKDFYYSLNKK